MPWGKKFALNRGILASYCNKFLLGRKASVMYWGTVETRMQLRRLW